VIAPHEEEAAANLARAEESLRAARTLLDTGHPDFAASRCYYAAFYAATALLLRRDMQFGKHSGVIAAIHRHVVRTGELGLEWGKRLNWLFELRSVGDYGETRHVTHDEATRPLDAARGFVFAVRELISKSEQ
jgi:uncharacterized protein (UPF0332 family)